MSLLQLFNKVACNFPICIKENKIPISDLNKSILTLFYRGLRSLEFRKSIHYNKFEQLCCQHCWHSQKTLSKRTFFYHFSLQEPVSDRLGPVPADLQAWAKRASVVTTVSRKREARWDLSFASLNLRLNSSRKKSRSRSPAVRKRSGSREKETKMSADSRRRRGRSPATRIKRSRSSSLTTRSKRSPSPTKAKRSRRERTRHTDSD